MIERLAFTLFALAGLPPLLLAAPWVAEQDRPGSSDHPLFPNRMPGYTISSYEQSEFDSYGFLIKGERTTVEGRKTVIRYKLGRDASSPGELAILRNYENAATQAGGTVIYRGDNHRVLKLGTGGSEAWVEVRVSVGEGRRYSLTIVERGVMAQVISADAMWTALQRDGFVALDIHFETAKAEIKPDSRPQVEQIAALMKANPAVRLGVEGHTDDVGDAQSNQALSEARAKAVVLALVGLGVSAGRMEPAGFGESRPVADNRTEEGRARNRRVELVKKKP
jgi:outer membrane protein OmpA-like peptidoglycan-associated protein